MGIRGLTKFIQNHAEYCMTDYQLRDTVVVIDGNAIICYLYNNSTSRNDAFGGDYDKFGQAVYDFFNLLSSCKITPYLVFDGGYGSAKIPEIMRRMHDRVRATENLEKLNFLQTTPIFPLHMWGTFTSIARKLNVKMIRCTFDCDLECANLGRALNCPVLSNDSDFYLCDILYIPLTTFELNVCSRGSSVYISCKIYRLDHFFSHFKGLDRTKLPLLAVLIGNDNSDKDDAWYLFNLMVRDLNEFDKRRRVELTISWLQKYNTDSAIAKITDQVDLARRKRLENAITRSYQTYTCSRSQYLKYLGIEGSNVSTIQDSSMDKYCSGIVVDDGIDKNPNMISEYFLENFKYGLYPSALMDIASKNRFYCYPQVDDLRLAGAHKSSLDVISATHKILNKEQTPLTFFGRTQGTSYGEFRMPVIEKDLPYIDEIEHMDVNSKQEIIAAVLDFNKATFKDLLKNFPESWHVLILAMKYFKVKTQPPSELVAALVLCKIILGHIDPRIGFYRSRTALHAKYPRVENSPELGVTNDIGKSLSNIPLGNCLYCIDSAMHFFVLQPEFRNRLDRNLIRSMSEFQACLLHLKYLDELLECPLEDLIMSECLNCTFVYQLTQHLKRAQNFYDFLKALLKNAPVVYNIVTMIVKQINDAGAC